MRNLSNGAKPTAKKFIKDKYTSAKKKKDWQYFSMCVPALIKIAIFSYLPMIYVYLAFVKYIPKKGLFGSEFIGLDNFKFFFKSLDFSRIFTNSIVYNLLFIFVGLIVAVFLALMLFEINNKTGLKFLQTSYFLPYFISWILVSYIVQALLDSNGMITLAANKIFNLDINFYTTPTAWYTILVIVNVWKGAGVNAIIYYATLLNCDASLFEAAEIDGANSFQKMWHISIPFLRSMICVTTIMSGANILRTDLGLFMFVPKESASLLSAVDTIDYYIWRTIRVSGNFSVGAAVGLVQGVVGLFLTIASNIIVRKIDPEAALY